MTMEKKSKKYKCDWLFVKRLWILVRVMFPGLLSSSAALFLLLLVAAVIEQVMIYITGLLPSRYYSVLGEKDLSAFKLLFPLSLFYIAAVATAKSSVQYLSDVLYIFWRQHLTDWLHAKYLKRMICYHINIVSKTLLDNPDQRITQDVERLCREFSSITTKLIISPLTIAYYTYQCALSTGWQGPVLIYAYFLAGAVINKLVMAPIVNLTVRQEKCEGAFRYQHMNIRSNSESIAFYNGERAEAVKTRRALRHLLQVQQHLTNWDFWLNFSVNMASYLGSILSYAIIAIPVFSGAYDHLTSTDLGALISANSFVCMYLIYSFTSLLELSSKISDVAGFTHRIGELGEHLEESLPVYSKHCKNQDQDADSCWSPGSEKEKLLRSIPIAGGGGGGTDGGNGHAPPVGSQDVAFVLDRVSICPLSSHKALVQELSLEIEKGRSVFITGNSGKGKTSLFRVLCGLWPASRGSVRRLAPLGRNGIFFLPQKTYLTHGGTLRQQLMFPTMAEPGEESEHGGELQRIVEQVGLDQVCRRVGGLDQPFNGNWYDQLSPGETQRVAFARLFFHQPEFAFLDESTSSLPEDVEAELYQACKTKYHMTLISVGHHAHLAKFHDIQLTFEPSPAKITCTTIQPPQDRV